MPALQRQLTLSNLDEHSVAVLEAQGIVCLQSHHMVSNKQRCKPVYILADNVCHPVRPKLAQKRQELQNMFDDVSLPPKTKDASNSALMSPAIS